MASDLFGEILSDLGSALAGSLGISANTILGPDSSACGTDLIVGKQLLKKMAFMRESKVKTCLSDSMFRNKIRFGYRTMIFEKL
jgi:hypothetical protein